MTFNYYTRTWGENLMSGDYRADAEKLLDVITLDSELNKIKDVDILLERILTEARRVVQADAGSIYIKKADKLAHILCTECQPAAQTAQGEQAYLQVF